MLLLLESAGFACRMPQLSCVPQNGHSFQAASTSWLQFGQVGLANCVPQNGHIFHAGLVGWLQLGQVGWFAACCGA